MYIFVHIEDLETLDRNSLKIFRNFDISRSFSKVKLPRNDLLHKVPTIITMCV